MQRADIWRSCAIWILIHKAESGEHTHYLGLHISTIKFSMTLIKKHCSIWNGIVTQGNGKIQEKNGIKTKENKLEEDKWISVERTTFISPNSYHYSIVSSPFSTISPHFCPSTYSVVENVENFVENLPFSLVNTQ